MRNRKSVCFVERIKKMHKDARGMSLVEVIIAITILGLVAVPVLHSLTTSMVYNAKARNRQEMTLTAESIMETFKGYDLDTLKDRFSTGAMGVIGIEGVDVAQPGDAAYDSDADTGSGFHYTYSLADPAAVGGDYTFLINDMKADNGEFYDVKITATHNSIEEVMVQDNMEPTRDAVFKAKTDFDTGALQKARDDFANNYKTDLATYFAAEHPDAVVKMGTNVVAVKDDIEKVFDPSYASYYVGNSIKLKERELQFEIKEDSGNHVVIPKMIYRYRLEDYTWYKQVVETPESDAYPGTPGSTGTPDIEDQTDKIAYPKDGDPYLEVEIDLSAVCDGEGTIYKNPTTAGLDRLFIYYYPQYNVEQGKDFIKVKNSAGITNFQCYVLKQISPALTATQLEIKDGGYKANVDVQNSAAGFELFHNFDDNIGDGSSTTDPTFSGTFEKEISYTGTAAKADGSSTTELAKNFSKQKVLSYKLELEITQNGRPVTTLESSMNEKIK